MRLFDFLLVTLITAALASVIVVFRDDAMPYPVKSPDVSLDAPHARPWAGIMIHSSGTRRGSLATIEKAHATHGGAPFHFVIGNGTETPDGAIEEAPRWREDRPGKNPDAIEVCIVGDLERERMTKRQDLALQGLLLRVCREKMIPASEVYAESEKRKGIACPGRYFDAARMRMWLQAALGKQ